MSDSEKSSAMLISSCKIPEAAALDAEKAKVSDFLRCEREVALVLKSDRGTAWKRQFDFFPFVMDLFGALSPGAKNYVLQFLRIGQAD